MKEGEFPGWETVEAIRVIQSGGITKVIVRDQPYMTWESGDEASRRIAIVQLYKCGLGRQEYLARAFGVHINSVQRFVADFAGHGTRGLISRPAGPKTRWKLTPRMRAKILVIVLQERICGLEAIQKRLKEGWHEEVSLPSIRQVLVENGLSDERPIGVKGSARQAELFQGEGERQLGLDFDGERKLGCQIVWGGEIRKGNRERDHQGEAMRTGVEARARRDYSRAQRVYLDELEEGGYNAYAGGLLFAPLLKRNSFLPVLRGVINIPTCNGYSLEELCLTLLYLNVFGFQSMEDFKRAYAEEFGVLVGRSKSPSHFTLRRLLHEVRELGKSEDLIDEFALEYLKHGLANWGVMYIDGHFLPYYGVYAITMGWHGVRKIPMKGSYNFLAVDEKFHPWLFLIRSSSEDLLQKIPELIEKAKRIGKKAGVSRERLDNLIVLFDREGYSAELYRYFNGKDEGEGKPRAIFISWAKYADRWVNDLAEEQFDKAVEIIYKIKEPEEIKYFEIERTMPKYGKIRCIVIQSGKEKKRAAIYTNGKDEKIEAERIVRLMCRRWGEENVIKELLMKHLIDYHPGYIKEELCEQPLVENPEVKKLKKKRAGLKSDLHKVKVHFADHMLEKDKTKKSEEDRKTRECEILENIVRIDNEILLTNMEIDKLPAEVRFDEAHDGERLLKLNYEKKRFLDCIKVFTYNMKGKMCSMLLNHYGDRKKEILSALSMIVDRGGYVKLEGGELTVQLRRFRNREIDYAARHLCDDLNEMNPTTLDNYHFPIRYEVQ